MPFDSGSLTINSWNIPREVNPGQFVSSQILYTMAGSYNANAVTYKNVLAEWQPDSPIAILESGILQGSPVTHICNFSFTAPTTPGVYRLRLAMTWAFAGIQHFYGDGPKGDGNNPGVGPWAEVKIRVVAPAPTDYFLLEMANGNAPRLSTSGGQMPFDSGSLTINSWRIPETVSGNWLKAGFHIQWMGVLMPTL